MKKIKKCGIYCYTNKINNKKYIGQSIDIDNREKKHFSAYYYNIKANMQTKFYKALKKYGYNNFSFEIIEECPKEKLNERECFYIEKYDTFKKGYNSTLGGNSTAYEKLYSKEVKEKRIKSFKENNNFKGEGHPNANITEEMAKDIIRRANNGEACHKVYEDYKEYYSSLSSFAGTIFSGKTWKHLLPEEFKNRPIIYTNSIFTVEQIKDIKTRYKNGESVIQIHKVYSEYQYKTIYSICTNRNYKHIKID